MNQRAYEIEVTLSKTIYRDVPNAADLEQHLREGDSGADDLFEEIDAAGWQWEGFTVRDSFAAAPSPSKESGE